MSDEVKRPAVTLGAALDEATRLLAASNTPRLDAETLLMNSLGAKRAALITRASETLSNEQLARFHHLLYRRQNGEPVAYIIGEREFWSLPFKVTPAVLIPRPETELLVECALRHIPPDSPYRIADLGTGSGAIGIAIAHDRPRCHVIATDTSTDALTVAQDNARRLGISNVEFRHGEWLAPIAGERLDLVVTNPPYIRANDPHLQEGDLRFEPRTALVGGDDGLDPIRTIANETKTLLRSGGWLAFEHGYDQAASVTAILISAGFLSVASHHDLAGHARVTEACRP